MYVANYEMGVVLPLREKSAAALEKRISDTVTYKRPLVPVCPSFSFLYVMQGVLVRC